MDKLTNEIQELIKIQNTNLNTEEDRQTNIKNLQKLYKKLDKITSSMINAYPYLTNKKFNSFLQQKLELKAFESIDDVNTYITKDFVPTSSQSIVRNIMNPKTPYNGLLLYHGVGVGKTCSGLTIAMEYFKIIKKYNSKIFIICPKSMISSWYKELFNVSKEKNKEKDRNVQCTQEHFQEYYYKLPKRKRTQHEMNKYLSNYFSILGYEQFANIVKKIKIKAIQNAIKFKLPIFSAIINDII